MHSLVPGAELNLHTAYNRLGSRITPAYNNFATTRDFRQFTTPLSAKDLGYPPISKWGFVVRATHPQSTTVFVSLKGGELVRWS